MKKYINKINRKVLIILFFLIGVFISSGMVFAATKYFSASDVEYNPSLSGLKSTNVQDAMDELYNYCTISKKASMAAMCPGCVYAFPTSKWYYNVTGSNERTIISNSQYKTDYKDLIAETGKEHFIGIILNDSNEISRVFTCGLVNVENETTKVPFCIESALSNGTGGNDTIRNQTYSKNNAIIRYLFQNNCTQSDGLSCTKNNITVSNRPVGSTSVSSSGGVCWADYVGQIQCS